VKSSGSGWVKWLVILFVFFAVSGIGVVACSVFVLNEAADELEEQTGPADDSDFELGPTDCEVGEFGVAEASGTITNTSDHAQGFEITVDFLDSNGVRLAEGFDLVTTLEEDEESAWSVIYPGTADVGEMDCDVNVNYTLADAESVDLFD
jgi:hypothetical protein